jgi:ubiquinone/menaquinone biosynthesis C-methylase UbiE
LVVEREKTDVAYQRDIAAFTRRAPSYEQGWLGRLHREIADRTVDLLLRCEPSPRHLLDVGCGTGYLVRQLADRAPRGAECLGVDPSPAMIEIAASSGPDGQMRFSTGVAEALPFLDDSFDWVVSTTSFDHWADQQAGLAECGRVTAPGGHLVLVDRFSEWLTPTLHGDRRHKARTRARASRLLVGAGFASLEWYRLYAGIIGAVTAMKRRSGST